MQTQVSQTSVKKSLIEQISRSVRIYTLKRFHPRGLIMDFVGAMWAIYFLWNQDWMSAVAAFIIASVISSWFTADVDTEKMAKSTLGKIALLHLDPVNVIVQICGLAFLIAATWNHDSYHAMVGVTFIVVGHMFGWSKVSGSFRNIHEQW